jgi:hypothetical protein
MTTTRMFSAMDTTSSRLQAHVLPELDHLLADYGSDLAPCYRDALEHCRTVLEEMICGLDTDSE